MAETRNPVFTVGHSNHTPEKFSSLLQMHGVDTVVDVRTAPYSRHLPHFNKEHLAEALKQIGVRYVFRGKELGGQPTERACYDADGHVKYDDLAQTPAYGEAIDRIVDRAVERRLALMCSEKEPLDCHRTLMVSQSLAQRGVAVSHIKADGTLESHEEALDRLLSQFNLPPHGDLFRSRDEVIGDAVSRQARKVGARWSDPSAGGAGWERAL